MLRVAHLSAVGETLVLKPRTMTFCLPVANKDTQLEGSGFRGTAYSANRNPKPAEGHHTARPSGPCGHVDASSMSESVIGPGAASTHLRFTYFESLTSENMCFTLAGHRTHSNTGIK